jgi:UDPglucose 6-dehydrogenase
MAEEKGVEPRILNTVTKGNYDRRAKVVRLVGEMTGGLKGKTIGLLGLAFKPNTDDMREAASIDIARGLLEGGAKVRAFDPVAMDNARHLLPEVTMMDDPYKLAEGCDALVVVTEWNEFKNLDLAKVRAAMKTPVLFDGRNIYEPAEMRALGFTYRGIGRGFNQ